MEIEIKSSPAMPKSAGAPGGKKKKKGRAPAHQNRFAFRHNPKSKKTDKILAAPNVGCCARCHEKIEWRKQYRRYKPLTQPGKCNLCQRRNVKAAYHTICGDCAVGDKANKAVVEALTGKSASGAANGKVEGANDGATESAIANNAADQQQGSDENAANNEDMANHDSDDEEDEEETSGIPRNRKVCAICAKDYALGSLEDDNEEDELAKLEQALEGKLKLREKRAIERKIERLADERRRNRRKATAEEEAEDQKNDQEGQDSGREDTKDANEDDSGDEVSEQDDPFLKAVGGVDKLLTGEAYQKQLLK